VSAVIRASPLRRWWISWIEAHRAEPFRVTDLAAALYVAPRTLQIAFREELGHPPLVEARRLRFRALRQALLNPRAPRRCLEALFESLGLPDSYLTRRQYRQWSGETPDETRARALG
jgi:transcriptional regulator GlxA family with amidase domain